MSPVEYGTYTVGAAILGATLMGFLLYLLTPNRKEEELHDGWHHKKFTEKRNQTRHHNSPSVRAFLQPLDGSRLADCWVLDWSEGGLGVFVNHGLSAWGLKPGDTITIKSNLCYNKPRLLVTVRHMSREASGWSLGLEFAATVTPSMLDYYRNPSQTV